MNNANNYRDAKRHVERKLGFYAHLSIYLVVNTGLVVLNLSLGSTKPWALFPMFGWGIGLLFHALAVYLRTPGAAWKQRMIENELKKRLHTKTE